MAKSNVIIFLLLIRNIWTATLLKIETKYLLSAWKSIKRASFYEILCIQS